MQYLTAKESRAIAVAVARRFPKHFAKFDASKYPDRAYTGIVRKFSKPAAVGKSEVGDALRWKYGHWSKANYPESHKALIARVAKLWAGVVTEVPRGPRSVFEYLRTKCAVPYISAAFLTHLLFPRKIPIIDQHNFRAMNHFLRSVRPNWTNRATPSNFCDLVDVGDFMKQTLTAWRRLGRATAPPNKRNLDKFLMAYGKSIKPKRGKRKQAV